MSKHYSATEKRIFLEILKNFKHVVEIKKSDSSTLRDKEVAWTEICKQYNNCTMILQERTVQQLKKLWENMKQTQRDALTKEKQACLATGGGPPAAETNIDPDITVITPHLMETAPVLFSSNMTKDEIDNNEDDVLHALKDGNMSILCDNYNDAELKIQNVEIIDEINKNEAIEQNKENQNVHESNLAFSIKRKENWDMTGMRTPKLMKEKKTVHTFTNEDDIKIQRIKYIMDQEKEMADIRKANEEKLGMMKEELHALEMRAALAKAELAELQLQNEKERLKKTYA